MLLELLQVETTLPAAGGAESSMRYALGLGSLFTLFFIMLGPLKLLGPYARATVALAPADARRLALKVVALATLSVLIGGFAGAALLENWRISPEVLEVAGGLIFLLVALKSVMQQYAQPSAAAPHPPASPKAGSLVFPLVLTPYGIATVILLLSLSVHGERTLLLVAVVLAIMLLNLLAMVYSQAIVRNFGLPLSILGAILGVLQVALALQIMVVGLRGLGAL